MSQTGYLLDDPLFNFELSIFYYTIHLTGLCPFFFFAFIILPVLYKVILDRNTTLVFL